MVDSIELAGDVVTGATALGGLLLVYIGGVATSYASFARGEQALVRDRHQSKAWFAVLGLVAAMLAAGTAIIGKWLHSPCMASVSVVLFVLSLLWGCIIAILLAREIH